MKKRIWAYLLTLTMAVGLLPTAVFAADTPYPYPTQLTIGSQTVEEKTYYNIAENGSLTKETADADNYNIYFSDHTLTLNDAALNNPIYVPGGTTVDLIGENTLGEENNTVSVGIQIMDIGEEDDLTIQGAKDASLTIYSLNEGIVNGRSAGDITIEGGKITIANTQSAPIYNKVGGLTITGDADVTVNSGNGPINCKETIKISENAEVTANSTSVAIHSRNQKIIISGKAIVKATGKSIAINGQNGIEILDYADVTATGSTALNSFSGSILIEGKATATADGSGQAAVSVGQGTASTGSVTITGELTAKGTVGVGVLGTGAIIIDGGNVEITSTLMGLYPMNSYEIEIKNNASVVVNCENPGTGGIFSGRKTYIEDSTVEVNTTGNAFFTYKPLLKYKNDLYTILAGDSKENAAEIPHENFNDEISKSKYVKIYPASAIPVTNITLSQETLSLYSNKSPKTANLTATVEPANATDTTINWRSSDTSVATVDENGTVTAVSRGTAIITAQVGTGENAKTASCTVTVRKKSSSSSNSGGDSSSDKTYAVSISDNIENGKVKTDVSTAAENDKVTITVTPDKGYEINKVTVKDADGNKIDLKEKDNGKYTFTMPDSKVEIKATFSKEEETPAAVEEVKKIILTINERAANVYGEIILNDVPPVIRNDRTMLPIRFVVENLGGTVAWDDAQNKVTITKGDMVIEIFIGSPFATVNGNPIELDAPAFIENSRTYLPLRFVAEHLGATVTWDAATQQVTILPQK